MVNNMDLSLDIVKYLYTNDLVIVVEASSDGMRMYVEKRV